MPPRSDLALIIDLEATGSNANGDDEVVEVGCVLLSTPSLVEVSSFTSLVSPVNDVIWQRMMENDVVRTMHEQSGLLADYAAIEYRELYEANRIDEKLVVWLKQFIGSDTTHVPYGGSGVSWYDRPLIQKSFPRFNRRISHWAYEIAALRRTAINLAGRTDWPKPTGKTHRALDDARHHADELRFAVGLMKSS